MEGFGCEIDATFMDQAAWKFVAMEKAIFSMEGFRFDEIQMNLRSLFAP